MTRRARVRDARSAGRTTQRSALSTQHSALSTQHSALGTRHFRISVSHRHIGIPPITSESFASPGCTPRPRLVVPGSSGPSSAFIAPHVEIEDVQEEETALADDSMMGRFTGSEGMHRAARYIAAKLEHFALQPAGDAGGFYQHMPLAFTDPAHNPRGLRLLNGWADSLNVARDRRAVGINVVGVIPGKDPELRGQVVLIDAHYDHIGTAADGICRPVGTPAICTGADDDASG